VRHGHVQSRTHPLSEALAELNRESGFQRITLRGLSEQETAQYISASSHVQPAPQLVSRVYEETEGNPFFLSEVVNLMAQEGTFTADSLSDIAIPDGVREAIGRRLNLLSEEANELPQVAAVEGREFRHETLSVLGDHDEDELFGLLEEGLAARVIDETGAAGRYRFTHALMWETLLGELSTTRRVRLHGRIGEALEERWGERADERATRLAQHFVESATLSERHAVKAMRYSKLAAEQAEAQAAWAEVARHYEHCLTLLAGTETELDEDEAALLTALGTCHRNAFAMREAWRRLMRARTLYQQRGDGAGLARATLEALRIGAPPDRLIAMVQEALEAIGEDEPYLEAMLAARASTTSCVRTARSATVRRHPRQPRSRSRLDGSRRSWF
jgi:predicted ATPase